MWLYSSYSSNYIETQQKERQREVILLMAEILR